jgi:hypothetical protein
MRLVPLIFCDQFDLDGHQCAAVRVHLKADVLPVLDSSVDEVRQSLGGLLGLANRWPSSGR